jgi:hypothetical protein
MAKLTRRFVKEHRTEIDACINKFCPGVLGRLNDNTRWDWVRKLVPEKGCNKGIACNEVCESLKGV